MTRENLEKNVLKKRNKLPPTKDKYQCSQAYTSELSLVEYDLVFYNQPCDIHSALQAAFFEYSARVSGPVTQLGPTAAIVAARINNSRAQCG